MTIADTIDQHVRPRYADSSLAETGDFDVQGAMERVTDLLGTDELHLDFENNTNTWNLWESGHGEHERRFNLSQWEDTPLLTREEATRRLGIRMGPLFGIIDLPIKEMPYSRSSEETQQIRDRLKVYLFGHPNGGDGVIALGGHQVKQLQRMVHQQRTHGDNRNTESGLVVGDGIIELNMGDKLVIGRDTWLPGVGRETKLLDFDNTLNDDFRSVSHEHVSVEIDSANRIIINNLSLTNSVEVEYGQNRRRHDGPVQLSAREALRRTVLPRRAKHTIEYVAKHGNARATANKLSPGDRTAAFSTEVVDPGRDPSFSHYYATQQIKH